MVNVLDGMADFAVRVVCAGCSNQQVAANNAAYVLTATCRRDIILSLIKLSLTALGNAGHVSFASAFAGQMSHGVRMLPNDGKTE